MVDETQGHGKKIEVLTPVEAAGVMVDETLCHGKKIEALAPVEAAGAMVDETQGHGEETEALTPVERELSQKLGLGRRRLTRTLTLSKIEAALVYGVHSIQGARDEMEDAHQAVLCHHERSDLDQSPKDDMKRLAQGLGDLSYFAVFDGHGGSQAAAFAGELLCQLLVQALGEPGVDPAEALRTAFLKTEEEWLARARARELFDGTTAAVALVDRTQGRCFIGNVGDSEVVLGRRVDGGEIRCDILTEVHSVARNSSEAARIVETGGRVWHKRLAHPKFNPRICSLAISRSIGDLFFKDDTSLEGVSSGLIADPYVTTVTWDPAEKLERILILGCDGLWDTVSHKDAVDFAFQQWAECEDPQVISEELVKLAKDTGSSDNITVMVVVF